MCLVETGIKRLPNQYTSKREDEFIQRYEGKNIK